MPVPVRVGTCSWVDRGLVEHWYPPDVKSPEARLRHYAAHFDVVEVNASYYAIPEERHAAGWAERAPDGFVFHVKAFGLMTGHAVLPEQLPPDLRPLVREVGPRGRVHADEDLRTRVFRRFHRVLEPLRTAGKLGGVLMQYPPGFAPSPAAEARLVADRELLAGDEMLVEFRQRDWLADERRAATLALLRAEGLTYVAVDAPRVTSPNVSPTVPAATSGTAYVRFHGRNAATWNVGRAAAASERFDHVYDPAELAEWVEPLRRLSEACERVYAMFNTNNVDQGPRNAEALRGLLAAAGVPVAPAPGPARPDAEDAPTLF